MSITFIFVLLAPITYGLVNIIDKYFCSKKIRNPFSYAVVVGMAHIIIGTIIASFLSWDNIPASALIYPAIIGCLYAAMVLIYYYALFNEDVSEVVAIDNSYPIIVAILSFFILHENIGVLGYIALALIILGVINLEKRMEKIHLDMKIWVLILMPIITGLQEFIIKLSTESISEFNALAINSLVAGTIIIFAIFLKKTREDFHHDIKNIWFALLNESLTVLAILFIFLAMKYYPATIVSAFDAIGPLFVLLIEKVILTKIDGVTKDKALKPKLEGVLLIIIGFVMMTVVGVI